MGDAMLAGRTFRIDPTSIQWSFRTKANDIPTMGGKVVQVFGTKISDMVLEGSFGVGGWQQQEEFLAEMKKLGTDQAINSLTSNSDAPPHRFIYPPRGWDFLVYLKAYSSPDGAKAVVLTPENFNPKWRLTLFILESNADLTTVAHNSYIARLAKGLGWKESAYNGGDLDFATLGDVARDMAADGTLGASGQFTSQVMRWADLVREYFPASQYENALRVMQCESEGNPNAINPKVLPDRGGQAKGLFQHMDGFWVQRAINAGWAGASIFDPRANVAVAAWLWDDGNKRRADGNGWNHWTCAQRLGIRT